MRRYSLASNTKDGKAIFKNVCSSFHVRWGLVVTKGTRSLKFLDLEQRGIADIDSKKKLLILVLVIWKDIKIN